MNTTTWATPCTINARKCKLDLARIQERIWLGKGLDIGLDKDMDNGIGSVGYRMDKSRKANVGLQFVIYLLGWDVFWLYCTR